jgi:ATP-dependent DNA helicase 2 subunit 2
MPQIKSIQKLCVPHRSNNGDGTPPSSLLTAALSALIVGLDLIMKYCKNLKYIKNLIILTDGQGGVDWSQSDDIAQQINEQNIKLLIWYITSTYLRSAA